MNELRKAQGLEPMPASDLLKMMKEKMELLDIKRAFLVALLIKVFQEEKKEMKSFKWLC